MGTRALKNRIERIKEIEKEINELQAIVDSLKDEIKGEMTLQDLDEMQVDGYTVRYKVVVTNRFDSKGFKKDHVELYNSYTIPTESLRFTIH